MELKKKDQGQRHRLGRCNMWVVVEGMGRDATPLDIQKEEKLGKN